MLSVAVRQDCTNRRDHPRATRLPIARNSAPSPLCSRLPCKGRCRENRLRFTRRRGWEKDYLNSITTPQSRIRDSSLLLKFFEFMEPRTPLGLTPHSRNRSNSLSQKFVEFWKASCPQRNCFVPSQNKRTGIKLCCSYRRK